MNADREGGVRWREWSGEVFEEARTSGKLVLLDLTASWCHWCHVMDSTTYSDPLVAQRINDDFIPVRVDIDRRPDISERYNRGGFPTTAFLSDRGELVWGATYVPSAEMKRIISAVLEAKSSGSIDAALAEERTRCAYPQRPSAPEETFGGGDLDELFEEIFSTYDVEHGGFGTEPKFPHPEVIELLLERYRRKGHPELAEAARHSLLAMADGLYDPVEGGVYRYSVTRDWRVPHYEKMLETNATFLRNLASAHAALADERFVPLAKGVAAYMLSALRDPETSGFFGSQDADEGYYKLPKDARSRRSPPSVDRVVYAGWNAEAVRALIEAGVVFREQHWIESALSAWTRLRARLWNPELSLVRHSEGQELYVFEDQVSFLRALLAVAELSPTPELLVLGQSLIDGVERGFALPSGGHGDVVRPKDAVGELERPLRSPITNSRWSMALALYGAAAGRPDLAGRAGAVLDAFSRRELMAYGRFAAPFIAARDALRDGIARVDVHVPREAGPVPSFWRQVKAWNYPGTIVVLVRDDSVGESLPDSAFAVVCGPSMCSPAIRDLEELRRRIAERHASQT